MSKISRREYLRRMGAAGALVGVSQLLPACLSSPGTNEGPGPLQQSVETPAFHFTPPTTAFPSTPNLTVLFGGIMGFSNTDGGVAQVGFQKGMGNHKLEIDLYEIKDDRCSIRRPIPTNGVMTMELEIPSQSPNVNFFHKTGFKRDLMVDDPRDFGWVLDFEDAPMHPGGVDLIAEFSPVLRVKQGTFYTHQLTESKFNLIEVGNSNVPPVALNQVPRLIGAAIEIPQGEHAVLRLNGREVPLPQKAGVRYQLQFLNDCYVTGGGHCQWLQPTDQNETVRNDFYMHYLMFRPKGAPKKYGVILHERVEAIPLEKCPFRPEFATDEAPCMGTGFGQKRGF